jgi:hypothetical protein
VGSIPAFPTISGDIMEQTTSSRAGLTFAEGLLLLFIGLKLTGIITWSPVWLPLSFVLVVLLVIFLVGAFGGNVRIKKRGK